ncbi:MAG TPA: hypothetical protein VK978_04510 [Candidatus Saccharimonadales bacterium]|nr:hypothetical protein [Candidatus Saccharimonadales bacterium]
MAWLKQILAAFLLCILAVMGQSPAVYAAESSSANYGVSEVNFGSGGSLESCSASYCSRQSAGELVVGNTSSANYSAQGGQNTNREPVLEMIVSGAVINLGNLNESATKSGSTTFSVRSFPAYGYNVIVDGTSLKNNASGHTLAPMASMATAQPGVEQFGINLRQNANPVVGGDPQHVPDSSFAFGAAATGYGTADNFKYAAGDTVAQSAKGTGQTNYTMSAIANISTNTPSGQYGGRLVLIAVPTF